jgi:hypothetical protein
MLAIRKAVEEHGLEEASARADEIEVGRKHFEKALGQLTGEGTET